MSVAGDILRGAKALLAARGWRDGLYQDNGPAGYPKFDYRLCAYNAIVESGRITAGPAVEFMRLAIDPSNASSIIDWNDKHGRRIEEVYAAYDRAIALAEAP